MILTARNIFLYFCVFSLTLAHAAEEAPAAPAPAPTAAPNHKSEISEILDSMGYPELQVVPRATERLAIEAKNEDSYAAIAHWPIQVAGLATTIVGFTAKSNRRGDLTDKEKRDSGLISSVATAVGVSWIVLPAVISLQRPYRNGMNAINKYPGKDDRSTLTRERLAEEALEKPARVTKTLKVLSTFTNAGANFAAGWHSNETGRAMAAIGIVLAFTPWIFEDNAVAVYEKHQEYKRKIYAPIKSASIGYDAQGKTFYPVTTLTWMF